MAEVALGLDVGTSGLKAVAVDARGVTLAEAGAAYPLYTPRPGWTEQNPADWLSAAASALRELSGCLEGHTPVALGLSGQMHGLVALDAHGEVIRPAPLWNDQRTAAAVAELEERVPRAELITRTGNPGVTGFQLPKLLWLRSEEPENFARTRHALLPKDYLGYALTGQMATEPSDASGVGALHLSRLEWDRDLLEALGLGCDLFPEVLPSSAIIGGLSARWAQATGLPRGLPVVAGAGDNAGAAVALGLSSRAAGVGSLSLGTSGVIFVPLDRPTPDPQGRVHLFAHADGGYHLLGVTLAAAGSLEWFRRSLAAHTSFETLILEAARVPPGAEGLSFVPYLAGERSPHLDPDLRGVLSGLSLAHGRGHIVRAILEGAAFALRDALEVMRPLAALHELLAVGGGARAEPWLRATGAILQVPLSRPTLEGSPARGAAILALVGGGVYPDLAAALAVTRPERVPLEADDPAAYLEARGRYLEASRWERERRRAGAEMGT
ncbi:xylulokinase [Deinobacterium chartae]|uniref:Xylulose kinase n=1 Tax=Deinobacterium chartae TaxID=521158 RepID=A0A841HY13_9DEIO|nr:xylulokinase [Deinobacterium chartae]MBB6096818.1 xylulokinase [Deinobacterium chartae]